MTITFEHPVRNPTFHFAGMGGGAVAPGYLVSASHTLTTAGQNFVAPGSGGRINMTVTSPTVERASSAGATANCATGGPPLAACGSAQTALIAAVVNLNLNTRFDGGTYSAPVYSNDGYRIQWSVDEDFGDAPASYDPGTDASHVLSDLALGTGGTVTAEYTTTIITIGTDSSPNAGAAAAGDSDNAFTSLAAVNGSATTHTISVPVSGVSKAAQLCGWIDFNRDGDFDNPSERACASVASGASSADLTWTLPAGTSYVAGNSYARFRLGYDATAIQNPTGAADSGEVEDYTIALLPRVRLNKVLSPAGGLFNLSISPTVLPAGTATATNVGNGGTTGFATVGLGTNVTIGETAGTGTSLGNYSSIRTCVNRAGGTVLASAAGTSGAFTSMASASGSANATPATQANIDNTEVTCTITNTGGNADLSITKSNTYSGAQPSDLPNDSVVPGPTTYTLVVTNNGPGSVTGAVVKDTPGTGITCSGGNGVTIGGSGIPSGSFTISDLTGAGIALGTLAAGQSATLTFQCTVT